MHNCLDYAFPHLCAPGVETSWTTLVIMNHGTTWWQVYKLQGKALGGFHLGGNQAGRVQP